MEEIEEFDADLELEKIKQKKEQQNVAPEDIPEQSCEVVEMAVAETTTGYDVQIADNKFVNAMMDNAVAITIAQEAYGSIKNQKDIAKKIETVAKENTNADIESASIKVEEKKKNNKVKRQEIRNELYRLKQEKIYLKRDSKQKLAMQKFKHRKEKYGDLLLRHCRKKQKNAEGKWEYQQDKDGNFIVNMPNTFVLFFLIVFDSIVMFLNQTSDIFSSLNKAIFKILWIIIICIFLFIQPVREWFFGLIGINFG